MTDPVVAVLDQFDEALAADAEQLEHIKPVEYLKRALADAAVGGQDQR